MASVVEFTIPAIVVLPSPDILKKLQRVANSLEQRCMRGKGEIENSVIFTAATASAKVRRRLAGIAIVSVTSKTRTNSEVMGLQSLKASQNRVIVSWVGYRTRLISREENVSLNCNRYEINTPKTRTRVQRSKYRLQVGHTKVVDSVCVLSRLSSRCSKRG